MGRVMKATETRITAQERRAQIRFGTRMLNQTILIKQLKQGKRQPRGK
jgi:hypothetical protein